MWLFMYLSMYLLQFSIRNYRFIASDNNIMFWNSWERYYTYLILLQKCTERTDVDGSCYDVIKKAFKTIMLVFIEFSGMQTQ